MTHRPRPSAALLVGLFGALTLGCSSWQREGASGTPTPEASLLELFNPVGVYQGLGRLVSTSEVGFVGTVAYLPGPNGSTRVMVGLSATNSAFSFERQGDLYEANYRVDYSLSQRGKPSVTAGRDATIHVSTLGETLRIDESIILQQALSVAPGDYQLTVRVTDKGSTRTGVVAQPVTVPAFAAGSVTAPILAYSVVGRTSRNDSIGLVLNPRGSVSYGGDTLLVYIEGVGMSGTESIPFVVRDRRDSVVLATRINFTGQSEVESRYIRIFPDSAPLGRLDFLLGDSGKLGHTTGVVSLSGNWIITNFEDLLSLLRYFGEDNRVGQMADASPAQRPEMWRDFFETTDPDRSTPENEALDRYFALLAEANRRFQGEGVPGWRTDRGEVFVTIGPPDEIYDSTPTQQGRYLRWVYNDLRLSLTFQDVNGFGRYRMTNDSRSEFGRARARARDNR